MAEKMRARAAVADGMRRPLVSWGAALLAGVWFSAADTALVSTASLAIAAALASTPALAGGGNGGSDQDGDAGGAGGTGFTGNPGSPGTTCSPGGCIGSGGGGGAAGGGAGGAGGDTGFGAAGGGPGGTSGSPNGINGSDAVVDQDGGGGGGGGGYNGNGSGAAVLINGSPLAGGAGGNGGAGAGSPLGNTDGGGGGGGGGGGYGAIVTGAGSNSNTSSIRGGNGGNGGAGGNASAASGGNGGNGGDGGVAIQFTVSGATFTNSGSVVGGNGGNGGTGGIAPISHQPGADGSAGAGGAGIIGSGLTVIDSGTISGGLSGNGVTRANAITFTGGVNTLQLQAGYNIVGNVSGTGNDSLQLAGSGNGSLSLSSLGGGAQYQGFATLGVIGGVWALTGTNTTTVAFSVSNGTAAVNGTLNASSVAINAGGTLIANTAGGIDADSGALTFNGGTLRLGSSFDIAIGGTITLGAGGGTIDTNGFNTVIGQPIVGSGGLTKSGAGILEIEGQNTYSGATAVNGGVLDVKSSINTASGVVVNSGGTLEGTGVVSTATVNNGGTLAPGNAGTPGAIVPGQMMTISGNLAFQSGAIYLVQLNPSASSFANVGGTAALNGATVNAMFASGSYVSKQYTILTAGAVSGAFGSFVNTNLPANFHDSLSYDATNVYLNLALNFGIPNSLNGNQQAVGNALTNFFNSTGGIPMAYAMLSAAQLSQASGELGTGSQQTTFQAMGEFMSLLADPFMNRTGGANVTPGATGYADEEGDQASAYAAPKKKNADSFGLLTKAPYAKVYEPRWSVWASGFGGSQSTDGNAATGSNSTTSSIYGTAVGADYLLSPKTIAGFAMAGGGTNFSVVNSGSGRSDLFQAGAYVRHTEGAAYITGALAYGWQDITTNRTVTIAGLDQLRSEFNANAYSGRVEGGYRYVAPVIGGVGITPYVAGQFTTFDLPAYAESVVTGSPAFALAYSAKSVTDARSELGIRTDKSFAVQNGVLTLRGRLAWAHDYDPGRAAAATFQALPGASFVVNGAAQASDSALTTASLEMKWMNGWSAAAAFEGEFSDVTSSYAGKGVVRYAW